MESSIDITDRGTCPHEPRLTNIRYDSTDSCDSTPTVYEHMSYRMTYRHIHSPALAPACCINGVTGPSRSFDSYIRFTSGPHATPARTRAPGPPSENQAKQPRHKTAVPVQTSPKCLLNTVWSTSYHWRLRVSRGVPEAPKYERSCWSQR